QRARIRARLPRRSGRGCEWGFVRSKDRRLHHHLFRQGRRRPHRYGRRMTRPPNITDGFDIDVQVMRPLDLDALESWAQRAGLGPINPTRKPRVRPPDCLRTKAEAAARLCCSKKTLNGHVASGALRYVSMGHGRKRRRMMFTDADLDEFIANQT